MANKLWPNRLLGAAGQMPPAIPAIPAIPANPANPAAMQGQPAPSPKSNLRFRSFAERYLVTRSGFFRQDPEGLAADTWQCLLDAKRAYAMIGRIGLHVED